MSPPYVTISRVSWFVFGAVAASQSTTLCETADSQIPDRISYPDSAAYDASLSSYYSGQEKDLKPGCIFTPESTSEVARFIKLAAARNDLAHGSPPPQFAIRSGGHTIWTGAANIEGGITVDLRSMNAVVLSEDRTVASLSAGGVWSDIYPQLDPYNLTVMGGRVSGIGVGGFSTGGK